MASAKELLTLDITGLKEWTGQVSAMRERLDDLSPVFEAGDEWFCAEMDKQFKTQGSHLQNGVEWAPLSPEYAQRKPEPPAPFGILYLTGDLYRSLSQKDDAAHVKIIDNDSGTYGTTIDYGKYHQRGDLPNKQRRIIIVRNALRRLFKSAITSYVKSGIEPGTRDSTK